MRRFSAFFRNQRFAVFKSVFTRFIIAFTLIFVISFSFLIVLIRNLVQDYSIEFNMSRVEDAETAVNAAKNMIDGLYSEFYADTDKDDQRPEANINSFFNSERVNLENSLSGFSIYRELIILVTNSDGRINLTFDAEHKYGAIESSSVPKNVITTILADGKYSGTNDLGGLLNDEHDIIALRLATDPAGSVFVCLPHEDLGAVYQDIVKTTVIMGVLVMAAGVIVIILLSEQIRSPLRSMDTCESYCLRPFHNYCI